LTWSPDDRYVASGTLSGLVQIGDMAGQKAIFSYQGHYTSVFAVAWSPNGKLIASSDNDNNVRIWQAV